ncbi:hypothetical protein PsYK624_134910 [Phanerochaete sordida]|uniref:F-box domain-containing protein n=1 Tax=Phanerochaete sordida TaxID=48140 RepID=A0A9P3GPP2_9APHY|nr:hypothetical protein PsYK624_134910 [Phanerochaete sordida]
MQTGKHADPASTTFTEYVLKNGPLLDLILWFSTPATMLCLSRACRRAHAAARSHIARCFNVHTHLSRYFASPQAFRELQERTGTLISGSTALQFFNRTRYASADLDLYCTYDARAEVGWWLIERAGYTFHPNHRQDSYFGLALDEARPPGAPVEEDRYGNLNGISAVYCFRRRVEDADGRDREVEVQLIVAYLNPMEAVLSFHSTVVLNVISYSHAYCLYPRATLEHRLALLLLPDRRVRRGVTDKYKKRGYAVLRRIPASPSLSTSSAPGDAAAQERARARSVPLGFRCDRHSWVLPVRADGAALLPQLHDPCGTAISRDPCSVTTWEMVGGAGARRIHAESVEPVGFGQSYIVTDRRLRDVMTMVQKLYVDVPTIPDDDTK